MAQNKGEGLPIGDQRQQPLIAPIPGHGDFSLSRVSFIPAGVYDEPWHCRAHPPSPFPSTRTSPAIGKQPMAIKPGRYDPLLIRVAVLTSLMDRKNLAIQAADLA